MLTNFIALTRLNKPIGILLLFWPTSWALWAANHGLPPTMILIAFCLGVILMRSAGCVINDIFDRNIDGHVKRTQQRPLATGQCSLSHAIALFVILSLAAFALTLLLNATTIALASIGFLLASSYPLMKRVTHLPQAYLGITFAWGIPMAYTASTATLSLSVATLYGATVFWVIAYDTLYAMVDREDDIRIQVKSSAILFGRWDRAVVAMLHALSLGCLILFGYLEQYHVVYFISVAGATLLAGYQQYLIRHRLPNLCFRAFMNNHWYGLIIFIGIAGQFSPFSLN